MCCLEVPQSYQKNPRAHKNKIGTPPPQTQNTPPLKRGILWTWVFPAETTHFPGVHKIDAPISGPRIADKNFTDTRIFLILGLQKHSGTSVCPCLATGDRILATECYQ